MTLLNVEDLKVHFKVGSKGLFGGEDKVVKAVNGVSFKVDRGSILGIVGESGCGKSTLVRGVSRLVPVTAGRIELLGKDLAAMGKNELRAFRKNFQMVFQDPEASLNPRLTVGEIIAEPIKVFEKGISKGELADRVTELMGLVGLSPYMIRRFPHEFSGGQRQRIGIARAISINPELLICDESVSALDVSIQAQIINLLHEIREKYKLTYLFISHDLAVVRYISDEIMVMYLGKAVEKGLTNDVINNPQHPYTKALISAVPEYNRKKQPIELSGEIPSPLNPPKGCAFAARCPIAESRCKAEEPLLKPVDGRLIACHKVNP